MELVVSSLVDLEAKVVKRKTQGWSSESLLNIVLANKIDLVTASREGCLEVVRLLLENGADVHAYDDEALRWASENGNLKVVALLESYKK
jgi:hypothetical protein